MNRLTLAFALSLLSASSIFPSYAHSGRTNAAGCHTNRRTGEYHCHNGGGSSGSSGSSTPSPLNSPSSNPLKVAEVISIGDGDTVKLRVDSKTVTTRLGCIDAPEIAKKLWGERAKYKLGQFLPVGQVVTVREIDTDRYRRSVAEIYKNQQSINLQMVREGYAVIYTQYSSGL